MGARTRSAAALVAGVVLAWVLFAGLAALLDAQRDPRSPEAKAQARAQHASKPKHRSVQARLVPSPSKLAQAEPSPITPAKPQEPEKPKPIETPDGQIVETARPETEEQPDKAKYLGRYDMKVAIEQKSQGQKRKTKDLGKMEIENPSELQSPNSTSKAPTAIAGAPKPLRPMQAPDTSQLDSKPSKRSEAQIAKATPQAPAPPTVRPTQPTAAPLNGPGAAADLPPSSDMLKPSVVRGGTASMILPSTSAGNIAHNMQALAGSPGSDDYLPDVDNEGDTNLLNTRKFRYWDFFQRVRERVRDEWNPAQVWQAHDPSGKRYGVRDRLTVVRVRLDPQGAVKELRVQKPSGLSFLDDEATRAFSAGGPYPNPPAGLVNEQGEVEFQFGFMFEISSSRFRFYRMDR